MTAFPRLLVATEFSPNAPGGGPAVVRQMLKPWPAEQLYWWSCMPERNELFGRKVTAHHVALIHGKLYPNRRWRPQRAWLLEKFWVPWAARQLRKTLADLQPDVIWAIPHAQAIPPLARVLPRAGIGLHVSIHDYMDNRGFGARFGLPRSRRFAALADQLYAAATTRDAISRPMLEDLRARTGRDGLITRAGLEQEDFDNLALEPKNQNSSIRVAYAGTIVAAEEFALVVRALGRIRERLPRPVVLEFFGDHSPRSRDWFDAAWMNDHGSLPAAELAKALQECDWGVSPMRLPDEDPRYNRFSLPTKFATYLAAGLPVIVLGHPESAVVKVARQYQVGTCATDGDLEALSAQLLAAMSEPNPKAKYRPEIRRCALAEFDVRQMRAALYDNFRVCAAGKSALKPYPEQPAAQVP
jgi:glycosyltransferase involved in cell wall biosynthesis